MQVVKERLWPPVARALRARPAWFFALVWAVAVGGLALHGFGDRAAGAPIILAPILFFCWLTVLLIRDPPPPDVSLVPPRPRLLLQTSVTVIAALFAIFALIRPLSFVIPLWITNPLAELLLPLVVLVVLGARPRPSTPSSERISERAGRGVPVSRRAANAPVSPAWSRLGLCVELARVGLWHFGANARFETHGDFLAAVFVGITNQAPYGLAFGIILQRTRNLLAGSVFHMVLDLP